jgi:hypothetical protein
MSIYQNQREAWIYQRLVASAGHRKRPKLREIMRAIIPYAVLFIVIQLMGAAIIIYLATKKDAGANQHGAADPPAPSFDSQPR